MIKGKIVAKKREQTQKSVGNLSPERIACDDAIAARYEGNPSPRELYKRGDIDQEAYDRISRLRTAGPPARPFGDLIAALRAERERQGLSLGDVAGRSGMDRAAIHKLEIGLNKNPTAETLTRYAEALGKRIGWAVADRIEGPPAAPAKARGRGKTPGEGQTGTQKAAKRAAATKAFSSKAKKKEPT